MKDAGCVFINYGIESMDQTVLNNMKKGLTPRMITQGVEATLKAGISPGLNFIFGNIGDNKETLKKAVDFMIKYDDFSQKRTIRPVTPYPGSPLYYDAIEKGLLDKDNPAEDFYEKKHLNSDLICCNFTELSDEEFYECLRWANNALMQNYYDKQKESTLKQIDYLYKEKDATFRGFRHDRKDYKTENKTNSEYSEDKKHENNAKEIQIRDNQVLDGMTNWEITSSDGDRFSKRQSNGEKGRSLASFDEYIKRKKARVEARKTTTINA